MEQLVAALVPTVPSSAAEPTEQAVENALYGLARLDSDSEVPAAHSANLPVITNMISNIVLLR